MRWDRWTASGDRMLMFSRFLLRFRGRRIDLHKIVDSDPPGVFHSHPANAVRVILFGGYEEELEDGRKRRWLPGMIGYVAGPMSHRLHRVSAPCFTLWIRGMDRFKPRTSNTTALFPPKTRVGACR